MFFQGTFGPMTLGSILMEPRELTKLIQVTKPDQLLQWHSVKMKCTTKEKKEGSGGKMVKVFVAIAHDHGAILCEQYEEQLTGQLFPDFVREHFENAFENSSNPREELE